MAYSLNDRTVLRAAYGINYSRRGAVGGRAGARNGTGTLGFSANASFPSANGFDPSYNWNNGVPSYPAPPFFDPTLNAGFVAGRGTGGGVTYGDPRDRRTAASLPELERAAFSTRSRGRSPSARHTRGAAATSSAAAAGAGSSRTSSIRASSCSATC